MARFFKNPDLVKNGKLAARLPIVPSQAYGDAPVDGLIRFNQDTKRIEFFYNSAWSQIAKIGSVQISVDQVGVGDGSTQTFTMSQAETDATAIAVFVGGVYQTATTHYTVSGTQINFQSAPPQGSINPTQIVVIHNINSTNVPA
jgi:hypothetical protein